MLYSIVSDIDECAEGTDDCVDDADCMNTDGSFTCTCQPGFTGDGRESGTGCQGIYSIPYSKTGVTSIQAKKIINFVLTIH